MNMSVWNGLSISCYQSKLYVGMICISAFRFHININKFKHFFKNYVITEQWPRPQLPILSSVAVDARHVAEIKQKEFISAEK